MRPCHSCCQGAPRGGCWDGIILAAKAKWFSKRADPSVAKEHHLTSLRLEQHCILADCQSGHEPLREKWTCRSRPQTARIDVLLTNRTSLRKRHQLVEVSRHAVITVMNLLCCWLHHLELV
jgi:hypothetical protein